MAVRVRKVYINVCSAYDCVMRSDVNKCVLLQCQSESSSVLLPAEIFSLCSWFPRKIQSTADAARCILSSHHQPHKRVIWNCLCLICVFPQQYILVSFGNVIVASAAVHLCDWETHTVNVTVAGNSTTLEVDGQLGLTEAVENVEPLDLSSSYSTFIGGIPGEEICGSFCNLFTLLTRCTHPGSLLQMFLWRLRRSLLSTRAAWTLESTAIC